MGSLQNCPRLLVNGVKRAKIVVKGAQGSLRIIERMYQVTLPRGFSNTVTPFLKLKGELVNGELVKSVHRFTFWSLFGDTW